MRKRNKSCSSILFIFRFMKKVQNILRPFRSFDILRVETLQNQV